jgi:FkbM family methyltransferase
MLKFISFLKKLYGFFLAIPFKIYALFNIPFKYFLLSGNYIKIYPKGQIAQGLFQGWFEKNETVLFQKFLKPGMTVIDAGANVGFYSLIAAKVVGINGKVYAFEPSKETFQRLNANIFLNNDLNIVPVNFGLGDKVDQKLILRQDIGHQDAERYIFPLNVAPETKLDNIGQLGNHEEILIDTLDNFCLKNRLKSVDFMKIDTEGFEYYILLGAKEILLNNPSLIILMECTELGTSRASTSQKQVFDYVKSVGLKVFYWNVELNSFCDDEEGVYKAGDVWICRSRLQLEESNN